jgi:DNA-binding response OmpR family regulator
MEVDDPVVILIVEDDQDTQRIIEEALTDAGFEPAIAASAEEASLSCRATRPRTESSPINLSLVDRSYRNWNRRTVVVQHVL